MKSSEEFKDLVRYVHKHTDNNIKKTIEYLKLVENKTSKLNPEISEEGYYFNIELSKLKKINKSKTLQGPIKLVIGINTIEINSSYFKKRIIQALFEKTEFLKPKSYNRKPESHLLVQFESLKIITILSLHYLKWGKYYFGNDERIKKVFKRILNYCLINAGLNKMTKPTYIKFYKFIEKDQDFYNEK
jgi:hypothetical protein